MVGAIIQVYPNPSPYKVVSTKVHLPVNEYTKLLSTSNNEKCEQKTESDITNTYYILDCFSET